MFTCIIHYSTEYKEILSIHAYYEQLTAYRPLG